MKKLFFFTILLLPLMAIAQNNNSYEPAAPKTFEFKHAIGGAGSMMSGYGLSYQYHITLKDRLEATAFVFMDTHDDILNNKNDDSYNVGNIGLEYHRLLASRRNGKLFLMLGTGYDYNQNSDNGGGMAEYPYDDKDFYNRSLIGGGGFVVEIYLPSLNITLDLDIGISYRHNMKYEDDVHVSTDKYLGIGVGGGLYYAF